MPLGEKLWEEKSKSVGTRIVEISEKGIREQVSFVGEIRGLGKLAGKEGKTVGTNEHLRKLTEGVITGTAQGVLTLGNENVSFTAVGLGKLMKKPLLSASKIVVLIQFIDFPPTLSWMNHTLVIWEGDIDAKNQLITATAYEWYD